jgi:type I restriction enzyme S subunit
MPLPLPPVAEQKEIANFLEREEIRINNAITKTNHLINLIREYRTRLIADVVTGKLDVRKLKREG